MYTISTETISDTISDNLGSVADVVLSTVESFDVSSIDLSNVVDTASDLAEVAGSASMVGGRIVVRAARRSGRFASAHPKGLIISIAAIGSLAALYAWNRRNTSASAKTDLKVAA